MDVVIIANAWQASHDNPTSKHQIAFELARMGHRVLWVEGAGMRKPSLGSSSDRSRIVEKLRKAFAGARRAPGKVDGEIHVLTPLLLPIPSSALVRRLNGMMCRVRASRVARRLSFRTPVLINYVPVLADAMRGWRGKVIYHCVDRWSAFDMYDSELMDAADAACCRYSDAVIASSTDLYKHCRTRHDRVSLVMHGVNHANFAAGLDAAKRPPDLPSGAIVGFFGLLSEWLDQDLICRAARELPDRHFLLIGRADVNVDRLAREPNVHLLGPRPFDELPAYIAHFDVGTIPFVVNELTRAVNPIKLREMLAAGCPVVSTALPEVEPYARISAGGEEDSFVDVASDADGFIAALRRRTESPPDADFRRRISDAVVGETWEAKTREIVEVVQRAPGG
jgi:glycosyltransferase involved in cell wall biosynthesis